MPENLGINESKCEIDAVKFRANWPSVKCHYNYATFYSYFGLVTCLEGHPVYMPTDHSGVFKVSIGVQTHAKASTGDIFLKNSVFSVKIPQMSGRYQALLTYVAADFELILSISESYSPKKRYVRSVLE